MIERILSPELVHALGWTLVHSLWQAAGFAIALGLLLVLLRKFSSRARYNVAIGLFAAFFLTAALTFGHLYQSETTSVAVISTSPDFIEASIPGKQSTEQTQATITEREAVFIQSTSSFQEKFVSYYNQHLPLIVTLWLMGVLVLQLRFLGQLAYIQRLKNYGTERFPAKWAAGIQELETRLGITRSVRYLTSFRVNSPFTVGWLSPVVLFPAALLNQLKESQVITILAHELAHVKRNDFAVNLIQTLLCSLFFYHPATWWMSARISEEREHCCDDLAIAITGEPVGYAKTLIQLRETELTGGDLVMAFSGTKQSGFSHRITRLIGGLNKATYGEGLATALILVLALGTAVVASEGEQPPNDRLTTFAPAETKDTTKQIQPISEIKPTPNIETINTITDPTPVTSEINERETTDQITYAEWVTNGGGGTSAPPNDSLEFPFLLEAINDGNIKLTSYFLDRGIDINQFNKDGWTPLMMAASEDQTAILRLLIAAGADVNFVNDNGWTALIEAADEGSTASVGILLGAGAKVDLPGTSRSALDMAASEGYPVIMEILIASGADITGKSRGNSPLHEAADEGNMGIAESLIANGVDVNIQDRYGRSPISYAAEEGNTQIAILLLKKGAEVDFVDQQGRTALSYAAEENNKKIFTLLLEKEASLNLADQRGRTPLSYAAEEGNGDIVALLLKKGAQPNLTDRNGRTPLSYAAEEGHVGIARTLQILSNKTTNGAATSEALGYAAREGNISVLSALLEQGADPNESSDDCSPLFLAAREGEIAAIQLLVKNGANLENGCNYQDIDFYRRDVPGGQGSLAYYTGAAPLIVALTQTDAKTVAVLLKLGTDVNASCRKVRYLSDQKITWDDTRNLDKHLAAGRFQTSYNVSGWTPLMEAVESGQPKLVQLLLNAGADKNRVAGGGMNALQLARELDDQTILNLLK